MMENVKESQDVLSLIDAYKSGDSYAGDLLYDKYKLLIKAIAHKYLNTGIPFDDLVSMCNIGMAKAIHKYDASKGFLFSTYMGRAAENEIHMYLRKKKRYDRDLAILDEPISIDSGEDTRASLLADELDIQEQFQLEEEGRIRLRVVDSLLQDLDERYSQILTLRYLQDTPMTQREVSEILGISQAQVSRLEVKLMRLIKSKVERLEKYFPSPD